MARELKYVRCSSQPFHCPRHLPVGSWKFISNQAHTVAPVALVVPGGAADTTTAVVTSPLKFDPATDRAQVDNAAMATTPTGIDLGSILGRLINNPVVGPIVLFLPLAALVIVGLPVLLPQRPCFTFSRQSRT